MSWNKLSHYATTVSSESDYYRVIYHSTTIVKWNSDEIILNSGGWQTATTKKKMNQASYQFNLGYTVYQENFFWFVTFKNETIPFVDHIVLVR